MHLPSPPQHILQLQVGRQHQRVAAVPNMPVTAPQRAHTWPLPGSPCRHGTIRSPPPAQQDSLTSLQPVPSLYTHPVCAKEHSATPTPAPPPAPRPSTNPCCCGAAQPSAPPYLQPLGIWRAEPRPVGPGRCQQLRQPAWVGMGVSTLRGFFGPARPARALQAPGAVTHWCPGQLGYGGWICRGWIHWSSHDGAAGLGSGLGLGGVPARFRHADRGAWHSGVLLCLPFLLLYRALSLSLGHGAPRARSPLRCLAAGHGGARPLRPTVPPGARGEGGWVPPIQLTLYAQPQVRGLPDGGAGG